MTRASESLESWHSPEHAAASAATHGLDLAQVRTALRARTRLIWLSGIALFSVVMAFTMQSRMEFVVKGRLYLGELEGRSQSSPVSEFSNSSGSDVYSEVEIMRSRSRVEQAVLVSALNATLTPAGARAPRYWDWLSSKRDPAILDVGFTSLQVASAALPPRAPEPRKFRVEFKDATHYTVFNESHTLLVDGVLGEPLETSQFSLTLIAGTVRFPAKGAKYDVDIEPTEKTVDDVLRNLDITVPKVPAASEPVKVLVLELASRAPHQAAVFLRALMQTHLDERHNWKTEDATAAENVILKQLAGMQTSLESTEHQLAEFRTENPAVVQQSQPQSMVTALATYEQQRTSARMQASMMESVLRRLDQPNSALETFMFGEADDAVLNQLGATLAESRRKLVEVRSKFSDTTPEVRRQYAEVAEQLYMIRNYVSGRLSRALEQVHELDGVIARSNKQLTAVPNAELKLAQIERKSDVYSRVYSYLLESQQRTEILKATTGSKNRILDWPSVPSREQGPNLWVRSLSFPLGLLLAALLVVMRSLSSGVLRSEAEVRSLLRGTSIFASVPKLRRKLTKSRKTRVYDLTALPPKGVGLAEAVRTLRTNLYHSLAGPQGKVILITSPSPVDGKTTLSLCLAGALAADEKRVLVIDADLRKPSHYVLTGHKPDAGLGELLRSDEPQATGTHTVELSRGQFDSLDAGFDVPAELLSSQRFAAFLIRAREQYDYIVLDSPSYPPAADALVLASQSDFVLTVVRLGNTPRATTEEHIRALTSRTHGHAVIVNDSDAATARGYARTGRATRSSRAGAKARGEPGKAGSPNPRLHEPPN